MQGKDWVELLKFPITILIAIAAIVVGSLILNIKPSVVEIGELKVELQTELTKEIINSNIELEEVVKNEVRKQLQYQNTDTSNSSIDNNESEEIDVVSDQLADLARISNDKGIKNIYKSTIGYIMLANYYPNSNQFRKKKIDFQKLSDIKIGTEYYVNDNMVIRENSPVNNVQYFKGEKKVGLAIKDSKIRILEKPEFKELSGYYQYWVKIKVIE